MPRPWRPVIRSALPILLAACGGGGHQLATIEPIPGSRTEGSREIVPLDSSHTIRRTAEGNPAREIVPLAHSGAPVSGEIHPLPRNEGEIRPLAGASAGSTREIVPLGNRPASGTTASDPREIRPLGTVGAAAAVAEVTGPADSLAGSTWEGRGLDGTITLEFLPDGTLRYTTADETWANGSWRQHADSVSFEMNSGYAEWSGRVGSTRMAGSAHNRSGRQWQWQADRR